jgi:hypothetical protein
MLSIQTREALRQHGSGEDFGLHGWTPQRYSFHSN